MNVVMKRRSDWKYVATRTPMPAMSELDATQAGVGSLGNIE
jgi:hypothetical protein